MATRQIRDASIIEALGVLQGAGMLYMTDELRETVAEKLDKDRWQDMHMLLVVQRLPLQSEQSADERLREAAMVVSALKWLGGLGWCTAKADTLDTVYQRIGMGRAQDLKVIVSLRPDSTGDDLTSEEGHEA